MKYIAAALLANLAGKEQATAADVKAILSSVGIDAEEERLSKLMSELEGKNINDLVAAGSAKLASVPSGGAVASSAPAAGGAAAAAAPAAKEEEKEEEEEEEDMGFSLFD